MDLKSRCGCETDCRSISIFGILVHGRYDVPGCKYWTKRGSQLISFVDCRQDVGLSAWYCPIPLVNLDDAEKFAKRHANFRAELGRLQSGLKTLVMHGLTWNLKYMVSTKCQVILDYRFSQFVGNLSNESKTCDDRFSTFFEVLHLL